MSGSTFTFAAPTDPRQVRAAGKALRQATPHAAHAELHVRSGRDAVAIVEAGNAGRVPELVPLRMGRMMASPFAFFRGAAAVMAADLTDTPRSGITAQICGDAHVSNFGFYASAERRLVMDINDFDETVVGPFEFDLKRLAASVVVAARAAGTSEADAAQAAADAVGSYRGTVRALAKMPVMTAWNLPFDDALLAAVGVGDLAGVLSRVVDKATGNHSGKVAAKFTTRTQTDGWRFVEQPPVLTQVVGAAEQRVVDALVGYVATLPHERRELLARYSVADVAFRVVGVGSVGTRAYVVLLHGNGDDAHVLQVKEARGSVYAGLPDCSSEHGHDGQRVVLGQKTMQTASDPLLGWTSSEGRSFFVRTFRDMKGTVDPALLGAHQLDDYARLCGALLARAHARSADARLLAGYVGKKTSLDEALVKFAVGYADRTEADHAALVAAVRAGRLPAETGI